jgi:phage terminase large subunit-like protein
MPDEPEDFDPLAEFKFKNWKPKDQEAALDAVKKIQEAQWLPFFCPDPTCDGEPHGKDWQFQHARADQRPPKWSEDWLTWLLMSGRGAGKTRTGSEVTNKATNIVPRIALIGATGPDLRETMIEGPSGILACAPPGQMPTWEPSRRRLTWPNGCVAQGYSGEEPDRIRGGNFGLAWIDEPAHIDLIAEVWANLTLALRIGKNPHAILTTTPKPIKWIKELMADKRTITTRVSTYANLQNLSPVFRQTILDSYEGTRWGRQELHGEVLEDVEGSLWKADMFHYVEPNKLPEFERIVIAVDPAGSANKRSDETGIIVLGLKEKVIYVLADYTGKYTPAGWAKMSHKAFDDWSADCIVAEKNYGGEMVKHTLESQSLYARIVMVHSRRGKELRAEPIVGLYEKERVLHVSDGTLIELENEMVEWVPGKGASPNRIDAMVHGATELIRGMGGQASVADPNRVLGGPGSPTFPTNDYRNNRRGIL